MYILVYIHHDLQVWYSVIQNARSPVDRQVVIATVQAASRRKQLENLSKEDFQLLIVDEAHHSTANVSAAWKHEPVSACIPGWLVALFLWQLTTMDISAECQRPLLGSQHGTARWVAALHQSV
eukprot:1158903-Pelagomonas_calceolata.AAC.3